MTKKTEKKPPATFDFDKFAADVEKHTGLSLRAIAAAGYEQADRHMREVSLKLHAETAAHLALVADRCVARAPDLTLVALNQARLTLSAMERIRPTPDPRPADDRQRELDLERAARAAK